MLDLYIDSNAHAVYPQTQKTALRHSLDLYVVTKDYFHTDTNVHLILTQENEVNGGAWIAANISRGDICVTTDSSLAASCCLRHATVLSPTGRTWRVNFSSGAGGTIAASPQLMSSDAPGHLVPDARAFAQRLETAIVTTRAANLSRVGSSRLSAFPGFNVTPKSPWSTGATVD
jgi:hypothetical protein